MGCMKDFTFFSLLHLYSYIKKDFTLLRESSSQVRKCNVYLACKFKKKNFVGVTYSSFYKGVAFLIAEIFYIYVYEIKTKYRLKHCK